MTDLTSQTTVTSPRVPIVEKSNRMNSERSKSANPTGSTDLDQTMKLNQNFSDLRIFPEHQDFKRSSLHEPSAFNSIKTNFQVGEQAEAIRVIRKNQSSGSALPIQLARPLQAWLGLNTKDVRIHTDSFASGAAQSLNANAFTIGRDIFFNEGKFEPGRAHGIMTLAHEMVHTAQQTTDASPANQHVDALENQANHWIENRNSANQVIRVGHTILREPTYPRRATGTAMTREVNRVLALTRDPTSSDAATNMWSNVDSNFVEVTAGTIARRVWTMLFVRHFAEPESRPGDESEHPRYLYSQSFGWIDAQHFFGFIDFAERHYQRTGDRQQTFDAATRQGIEIEADQQTVRDYIVAGASPDPGPMRYMQVRPPNTPLFRLPQAAYATAAQTAANLAARVRLRGSTEGELFALLSPTQRSKFWVDSAKSAFTYEDIPSDQLGTRFFLQHGIAINALPLAQREAAFRTALASFFSANGIVDDATELDRQAIASGLPGVERFLAPHLSEADVRLRYPSLFTLPP